MTSPWTSWGGGGSHEEKKLQNINKMGKNGLIIFINTFPCGLGRILLTPVQK
jgi:hypothetical protein